MITVAARLPCAAPLSSRGQPAQRLNQPSNDTRSVPRTGSSNTGRLIVEDDAVTWHALPAARVGATDRATHRIPGLPRLVKAPPDAYYASALCAWNNPPQESRGAQQSFQRHDGGFDALLQKAQARSSALPLFPSPSSLGASTLVKELLREGPWSMVR